MKSQTSTGFLPQLCSSSRRCAVSFGSTAPVERTLNSIEYCCRSKQVSIFIFFERFCFFDCKKLIQLCLGRLRVLNMFRFTPVRSLPYFPPASREHLRKFFLRIHSHRRIFVLFSHRYATILVNIHVREKREVRKPEAQGRLHALCQVSLLE